MKLELATCGACVALLTSTTRAAVQVDGIRDVNEGYQALAVQSTVSNWGEGGHEALANLHAVQRGNTLAIHLAARVKERGIILFIDSKPGGHGFIPNNVITSGGEEWLINNFGQSASSGMTFESGFQADYAIRIYGDGDVGAFVNTYDLSTGVRAYAGNAGFETIASGIITQMRAFNLGLGTINSADYGAANQGVEAILNLTTLGMPTGAAQSLKLMAVLVNVHSSYASNQVLASQTSTSDIGFAINSIDFNTESGTQTITMPVDHYNTYASWTAAHGSNLAPDKDADGDGVTNGVEYFMGESGSSFTANPQQVAGLVTWPRDPGTTGLAYQVLTSINLTAWDPMPADTSDPMNVKYQVPAGDAKRFVRLEVTIP